MSSELVARYFSFANFPSGASNLLQSSVERSFLAQLRDTGYGATTLLLADADAMAPDLGGLIAYDVDGTRAFVQLVQSFTRVAKDPEEEAGQKITWSGPGHLGVLKWGVVRPPGGVDWKPTVDDVVFDYTHPDYDDSGWSTATEVISVEDAKLPGAWGLLQTWASDMPENALTGVGSGTTFVLWASDGTTGGTTTGIGTCYFRDTFTVSAEPDGGHILFFTCDNYGTVHIDGKEVCTAGSADGLANPFTSGFRNATIVPVDLSTGTHTIAIKATNREPFGAPNPGGIACNIYNPEDYPFAPGDVKFETTSAMKITEYAAEPPGMTAGNVMRLVIEAEQAEGRLTFLDALGFDDTDDTDSIAWAETPTISTKVGTDLLTFFREIVASGYCEIEMDPASWTLNAWNPGGKGTTSGVDLTDGSTPVLSLTQRGEDTVSNYILARYKDGYIESGTGGADRGAFVELGPQPYDEALRITSRLLVDFDDPREEITALYEVSGAGDTPYVNANLVTGSTLVAQDSTGGAAAERITEIGGSESAQGERLLVTATLRDPVLETQERFVQEMKR